MPPSGSGASLKYRSTKSPGSSADAKLKNPGFAVFDLARGPFFGPVSALVLVPIFALVLVLVLVSALARGLMSLSGLVAGLERISQDPLGVVLKAKPLSAE